MASISRAVAPSDLVPLEPLDDAPVPAFDAALKRESFGLAASAGLADFLARLTAAAFFARLTAAGFAEGAAGCDWGLPLPLLLALLALPPRFAISSALFPADMADYSFDMAIAAFAFAAADDSVAYCAAASAFLARAFSLSSDWCSR